MFQAINLNIYDKINKKLHFFSAYPFDFAERVNFSFDGFLLAINFNLALTYDVLYISLSGIKARTKYPFHKFNNWFSGKLVSIS